MFDEKSYNIRTQMHYVKTLKERYPNNREIREQYYIIKRMFEKAVRKNKTSIKEDLLNKMNNFHDKDTKKYWDIFNELRNVKKDNRASLISADEWLEYYTELYHKPLDMDNDIKVDLEDAENINSEKKQLDYEISDKEMYDMIGKLKHKKTPGPDGIINEMIKCGKFYLAPLIKKLFNHILTCGVFPSEWKKGFIINIHKAGSFTDPNNYRGITLSSCLGKMFSLILNARLVDYLNVDKIYSEFPLIAYIS